MHESSGVSVGEVFVVSGNRYFQWGQETENLCGSGAKPSKADDKTAGKRIVKFACN